MRYAGSTSSDSDSKLQSLYSFLRGGDEDCIASSHPLARTSSNLLGIGFLLGIVKYRPGEEYPVAGAEYGTKLEDKPNLDLFTGTESARTGELWFGFNSIGSRSLTESRSEVERYLTASLKQA